jgi:hypothetical protein
MTVIYDTCGKIIMYSEHTMDAAEKNNILRTFPGAQALTCGRCDKTYQYVDTATCTLASRPEMPAVQGVDGAVFSTVSPLTMSRLPAPCTIYIDGTPYECNESSVELDLPMPGTYRIRIEAFPYLNKEFTVEIDA